MAVYLEALINKSKLGAWYPLQSEGPGDAGLIDESGEARHLISPGPGGLPQIVANQINGRQAVVFSDDDTQPFQSPGLFTPLATVVAIMKVDGVNFGAHDQGWLTPLDSSASIVALFGPAGQTKWGNTGVFTSYRKSGTSFLTSNMQAPFAYPEMIEAEYIPGASLQDGIQIGMDREDWGAKNANGILGDLQLYTQTLTAQERAALKLYGDLKCGLYLLNNTPISFPSPNITGILWNRFKKEPTDWEEVTGTNTYADGGKSFNLATDTPPKRWSVEFTGLSYEQMEIFDAFNDEVRRDKTFVFTDKWGAEFSGVRIEEYRRDHEAHKSWVHSCSFKLVRYP